MKIRTTQCPSCGGPVQFRARDSLVTVCEYCSSIVARGDRGVEDWGKVADLALTQSPFELGMGGHFQGRSWRIIGRIQYAHAAGGVWDEWFLYFSNKRWAWLSEAQGKLFLLSERETPEGTTLPAMESLEPGRSLSVLTYQDLTVGEVGSAQIVSAAGELPFPLKPGSVHRYADLFGPYGRIVTLDYNAETPKVFAGHEISIDRLGIRKSDLKAGQFNVEVEAKRLNCPNCGGPLKLIAPDKTERVCCPNCHSLLDVSEGNLQYLHTLRSPPVEVLIPLGRTGKLDDVEYTVIGMMQRFVIYDNIRYPWTEYLLYSRTHGFRWLVHSDCHWSFVETVSPGDVTQGKGGATWNGRKFKLYQLADATVSYVVGEFYWKVEVGEKVNVADYVSPPYLLSVERSTAAGGANKNANEVNFSIGKYLPHEEVKRAFRVKRLPRGFGVAPNQPFTGDRRVLYWWPLFAAIILIAYWLGGPEADRALLMVALTAVSIIPVGMLVYWRQFEVSRWKDSEFSPYPS